MSDEEDTHNRLYHVLNISPGASESEIRESYRRLSRLFHPDKHATPMAREKADPRFQDIQQAFEVLSDPHKRVVYDTLGEEGLKLKLEVGQRNMTPDQLRAFFRKESRQIRVDELDTLVQNRGESSISMDARSLFGGRVVIEKRPRIGSPIPVNFARPASISERFSDVMFRGMGLRNSWTIPFNLANLWPYEDDTPQAQQKPEHPSSLTFTGHAVVSGRRQLANYGVLATVRHQLNQKTSLEATVPLIPPRSIKTKITHQYSPELFITADIAASTLAHPPSITITSGRQITERGVLFGTLRSGSPWKLAGWGQYGNAASYILGWTRNPVPNDPTGYTVELITGLQVLGVAADYNTSFKSAGIKFKAGGSATTSGFAATFGATRSITEHAKLGANITANAQSLIVGITFSRLGQTFKLPIWIGDGVQLDAILYGIVLPVAGLVALEYLVVIPRRDQLKVRQKAQRKKEFERKLADKETSAKESVELMTESVGRKQQTALAQSGLYIAEATYGSRANRIDVTIAIAAHVHDNQLVLANGQRKSTILGIWDPDFAELKTLRVEYLYGGDRHFIEIEDKHGLALPARAHLVS